MQNLLMAIAEVVHYTVMDVLYTTIFTSIMTIKGLGYSTLWIGRCEDATVKVKASDEK